MSDSDSICYIIGAGFSCSFGVPLLNDLFSEKVKSRIDAYYRGKTKDSGYITTTNEKPQYTLPSTDHKDCARGVSLIYEDFKTAFLGRLKNTGKNDFDLGLPPWANAEEFSEWLDQSINFEQFSQVIQTRPDLFRTPFYQDKNHNPSIDKLKDYIRFSIAVACSYSYDDELFQRDTFINLERVSPYLRFLEQLRKQDSVISFNYDLIVEKCDQLSKKNGVSRITQVVPKMIENNNTSKLYKLHGSVNWVEENNSITPISIEDFNVAKLVTEVISGNKIAIGIPGKNKTDFTTRFKTLWDDAKNRLQKASTIVFIGYRFPQSDANAKRELLSTIENSESLKNIHVVLGDNVNSIDCNRLEGLLKWALRKRSVEIHKPFKITEKQNPEMVHSEPVNIHFQPLFAEDFLTVFDRDILLSNKKQSTT